VSRETTFSTDVRDPGELETILLLFVTRVSAQLRDEHLMARTVTLKLRHDDFTTITRSATLREATDVDRDLFEAVRPLFLAAFTSARLGNRGVRLVGVSATNLTPASAPDLFEAPAREKLRQLTRAVDAVRKKFGDDAVAPAGILGLKRRS
jgi:DNA polymerase-4